VTGKKMPDFKSWLEAKMEAIDDELGVMSSSQWGTLRDASLREQWAKYRHALSVHMEFEEELNAKSTR